MQGQYIQNYSKDTKRVTLIAERTFYQVGKSVNI